MSIPVTVVTGFLGAGKTTLLSNLLSHCPDHEIAILVNEFGQTSIDGAVMERRGGDQAVEIHQVNNGLIAYSDDKQFMPAMRAIMNRQKPIDNLLVETSGLALPTAVMASLAQPELDSRFQLDAVLAVVDTEIFLSGGFDEVEQKPVMQNVLFDSRRSLASLFKQQLENADVVILNKVDKLKEEELILCELKIRKLAPRVRFVESAYHAHLNPRIALGLHLHEATHLNSGLKQHQSAANDPSRQIAQTVSHSLVNGHSHSGIGAHEHGLHTHEHLHEQDPAWVSFVLNTDQILDADILRQTCESIARAQPVLRLKGFFKADGYDNCLLIQGVRDKITCVPQDSVSRASQIVFIGYHLVREKVKGALTSMTGVNWY